MIGYTISMDQIEAAAETMSRKVKSGWLEYKKGPDGEWVLDYLLQTDEVQRKSTKIYADGRPSEVINWGSSS